MGVQDENKGHGNGDLVETVEFRSGLPPFPWPGIRQALKDYILFSTPRVSPHRRL